jgi:hypothetical protein
MKLTFKIAMLLCIGSMLFNSCSNDDSADTNSTIIETSTLKTFKDVTFSLDKSEGYDAGLYFSTELGKSFKTSKIDATVLPKIDIEFYSDDHSLNYFLSPNDPDYGIEGATQSLFINAQKDLLTIDQFNKIEKGSDFDTIKIDTDDDESFPDSQTPNVVLFKNAAGKKGAIYIKSIHRVGYDPRIVVDIKIQK